MKGKILGEYPIIFAVLLASATSHATSISFSDSTFQESDWTVKNFTLGYPIWRTTSVSYRIQPMAEIQENFAAFHTRYTMHHRLGSIRPYIV